VEDTALKKFTNGIVNLGFKPILIEIDPIKAPTIVKKSVVKHKKEKQLQKIIQNAKSVTPMEMSKISERSEPEKPSETGLDHDWFKERKPVLKMEFWDEP
jgi:hypothetical protein